MAAGIMARPSRRRPLQSAPARWRGYRQAVILSGLAAAGLAGLALLASQLGVVGPILLFDQHEWPFWLLGVALTVAVGVLVQRFARQAPPVAGSVQASLPTEAFLPAVATLGGVLLVSLYHTPALIWLAPAILAPTLGVILIARYHLHDEAGRLRRAAQSTYLLLTYGVAFAVLAAIYINKARSILSASLVAFIACLLLVQIAAGERFPAERRLLYGLVGGVILGQVTWALNYWPLTGWTGGAVLLIAFYFIAGLLLAQIREGVRRRDLLEYGLSALCLFALVVWSVARQ